MSINKQTHKLRLDTHESASHINLASNTLRGSRVSGILCGVPAPTYRKIGRKVVYDRAILDQWLDQFANQPNTAGMGVEK
jgi:hypothetical protein